MLLFYTAREHQKTLRFSDVFSGYKKATLGCIGLNRFQTVTHKKIQFRSFGEVCPPELELRKDNDINTEWSFLNLGIKVKDNKFSIRFHDKREDFPFHIVIMPYLRSNIPSKIFYPAFGEEIMKIARATSTCNGFRTSFIAFLDRV